MEMSVEMEMEMDKATIFGRGWRMSGRTSRGAATPDKDWAICGGLTALDTLGLNRVSLEHEVGL
jgi:hypothetical protein